MKRNIILMIMAAFALFATSCEQKVPLGEWVNEVEEGNAITDDETVVYGLSSALQIDPMNLSGIDLLKHMDIFDGFTFTIYREDGEIVAAEIDHNLPFEFLSTPLEGKQACYFDADSRPQAIRLTSNDALVATYVLGEFYIAFQLGCKEVSYELHFK